VSDTPVPAADSPEFESPIRTRARAGGPLLLDDRSAATKLVIRAVAGSAVAAHLAVPFGASREDLGGALVCGSRPGEWLVLGSDSPVHVVGDSVGAMATGSSEFASVVDISHGRAMFRMTGSLAVLALAKVCSIDLADHMTPDGAVVSGSVADVVCDLVRDDQNGERSYLILCDRSFGEYLFTALLDAIAEFDR
jgi:sarcosine oxidase subunit alpha